jgi:universal stress protein A
MKVLISCDFSEAGTRVLKEAHEFLHSFPGAEIHIFTVINLSIVSVAGMYNNGELMNSLQADAAELGKKAEAIFGDRKIHFSYEVGYPAEVVRNKATNLSADLLILGTHGRTGLNRLVIGSVAETILRHVNCKTLIIPVKQ